MSFLRRSWKPKDNRKKIVINLICLKFEEKEYTKVAGWVLSGVLEPGLGE
jgi:hypothetical protein